VESQVWIYIFLMPYDVQPPPSWLEDLLFPQEFLDDQSICRIVGHNIVDMTFLMTVEDYKKALSLEDAAVWNRVYVFHFEDLYSTSSLFMQLVEDNMARLAIVYKNIQCHHLEFRMVISQEICRNSQDSPATYW